MLLIFHFWSGGHRQLAVQQHSTRNAHNTQQQHIHARTHTPNTSAWLIRTADSIDKRNHAKHSSDTNYKHIQFVFVFHWLNYKRCGVVPLIVKHVHTKPQYEWQCARRAYQFRAHCQELLLSKLLLLLFLRHPTTETNINEISTKNEWERQSCTNCSTVFVYASDTHTHTRTLTRYSTMCNRLKICYCFKSDTPLGISCMLSDRVVVFMVARDAHRNCRCTMDIFDDCVICHYGN